MIKKNISVFLLFFYSLVCLFFLSWQANQLVSGLRRTFFYLLKPVGEVPSKVLWHAGAFSGNLHQLMNLDSQYRNLQERWVRQRLDEKALYALRTENERLRALLSLPPRADTVGVMAVVWARDPQDWYRSILVRLGKKQGVAVGDPVVALQDGREVLVGRVVEDLGHTCKVLLISDSLSAVSARIQRTGEEGIVEGQNSSELMMNYLFADSDVRVGDDVVTAGLGGVFPEGILIGSVHQPSPESISVYRRAALKPAVRLHALHEVIILVRQPRGRILP
ncbi:MAG TPA: rod shape-determining protein MreC [Elusimicrobiota bacterium]|nr:rod shape-determining protein MreC [Elusimicrobiota bacterium]